MTERVPDRGDTSGGETTVRQDRGSPRVQLPEQAVTESGPGSDLGAAEPTVVAATTTAPDSDATTPVSPEVVAAVLGHTPTQTEGQSVDLTKRDDRTVPVDRPLPPSWNPGPSVTGQPSVPGNPASPQGPPPSPWSAQSPQFPTPGVGQPPQLWPTPPATPWPTTRAMPTPAMPPSMPPPMLPPSMLPPPTPPLPAPRGRGPAALIVFGVLAALIIAGGAWALISLAAGSSPFGPRANDPVAEAPSTDPAPVPANPVVPPGTDPDPPTRGPSGQATVSWNYAGITYRATLTTAGATGQAVVTYLAPQDEQLHTVRQDLRLASVQGNTAFVGSDPVDADTGLPATSYSPDVFVLGTNPEGKAYVDQVCDGSGVCSPATME